MEHPAPGQPVPCWYCNTPVTEDENGRLLAVSPAADDSWACPASPQRGHHPPRLLASWDDTPEMKMTWVAYDVIARARPDCEHNRAWLAELAAVKQAYHKALKNRDKLWAAQEKEKAGGQEEDPAARPQAETRRAREARSPAGRPAGDDPGPG